MPAFSPQHTSVKTIQWAGYTWDVTDYSGGTFTSDNVWVDSAGRLHMKLIYDGRWHDFDLVQQGTVGYGTYKWTIASDVDRIQDLQDGGNPNFVFSPFLYDNTNPGQNYGELDIEMCKWGADKSNTDWTIHPAGHLVQGNHFVGAGNTYTLEWMPDHITFTAQGPDQPYKEWVYTDTSGIPRNTGGMHQSLHIGQFKDAAPPNNLAYYEAEVVLSDYTYTPCKASLAQEPAPVTEPSSASTPTATPRHTFMDMSMPGDMSLSMDTAMPSIQHPVFAGSTTGQTDLMAATDKMQSGPGKSLKLDFKWPLAK
jgi:hypothetical protein